MAKSLTPWIIVIGRETFPIASRQGEKLEYWTNGSAR